MAAEGAGAAMTEATAGGAGVVTTEAVVEGAGALSLAHSRSNRALLSKEPAHLMEEKLGGRIHGDQKSGTTESDRSRTGNYGNRRSTMANPILTSERMQATTISRERKETQKRNRKSLAPYVSNQVAVKIES
jgi:hypothetical protein